MVESAKVSRNTGESKKTPRCVAECNLCMGAVVKVDTVVTVTGTVTRKSMKWYQKYFFHLLDITALYRNILQMTASAKKRSVADFRLELASQLVEVPRGKLKAKGRTPIEGGRSNAADSASLPVSDTADCSETQPYTSLP